MKFASQKDHSGFPVKNVGETIQSLKVLWSSIEAVRLVEMAGFKNYLEQTR